MKATKKKKAVKKTPKAKAQKARRPKKVQASVRRLHIIKKFLADQPPYKLSIQMGGETFTTEADDIFDALMEFKPAKITSKIILTIERGEKKFTRYVMPHQARRIFINAMTMKLFIKGLMTMLG